MHSGGCTARSMATDMYCVTGNALQIFNCSGRTGDWCLWISALLSSRSPGRERTNQRCPSLCSSGLTWCTHGTPRPTPGP